MITIDGVVKRYGSLVAVDGLSFRIDRGEVVGFLGPNGAGKTTTMRMIVGTLQPDAGRVLFDGVSIGDDPVAARRRVGYLPETNALYDDMLVCEYLEYAGNLRGLAGAHLRRRVRTATERTALEPVFFRPIAETSKGYRQRIGLAAAILHEPDILILDEPTQGLDPNQRIDVRHLVSELGRNRTVLISTHVMQEVEATCQRLVIVNNGRLVTDGPVSEVLAGQSGVARYVVEAKGDDVATVLSGLAGVAQLRVDSTGGRIRVSFAFMGEGDPRPRIAALAGERGWELLELHRERPNLEQVFRQLTGAAPDDDVPPSQQEPATQAPPSAD